MGENTYIHEERGKKILGIREKSVEEKWMALVIGDKFFSLFSLNCVMAPFPLIL